MRNCQDQQNWLKQGGMTIRCANHKLITSIWNKELPEEWKESIIIPIYKKGDETDCNNYRGISLLPTTYKILSSILLSRLTPYAEEVIGDHQCGFRRNRSTTYHIFCIRQILEKKWEYNEAVHQLFIDFKKAYDSVRMEVLYNILIEFGIPKKMVRLVKCVWLKHPPTTTNRHCIKTQKTKYFQMPYINDCGTWIYLQEICMVVWQSLLTGVKLAVKAGRSENIMDDEAPHLCAYWVTAIHSGRTWTNSTRCFMFSTLCFFYTEIPSVIVIQIHRTTQIFLLDL